MTKSGLPTETREMASSVHADEMSATDDLDSTNDKSVKTDAASSPVQKSSQQLQSDATGQPGIPSSTDGRQSSATTKRLRPEVRTVDSVPEVVHLLVRENLADDHRADAELGRIVQLCLETDEQSTNESIPTDSELAKELIVKCDRCKKNFRFITTCNAHRSPHV